MLGSKKVFKTSQQIKDALFQVQGLDFRQRPVVYETLVKELSDSGVNSQEIENAINELHKNGEIAQADKEYLLELIKK